jgi:hypothetical protein
MKATIHIFGYGETQVISKEKNAKVSSSTLTTLENVIQDVFSKKPSDLETTSEYHAINIFVGDFVTFIPKEKGQKSFRVKYSDLNAEYVTALINEIPVPEKAEA